MVPIDFNGFRSSFTPNPDCSRETWKGLYQGNHDDRCLEHQNNSINIFHLRLQQDPPAGVSGAPTDNNIMLWNAVIFG